MSTEIALIDIPNPLQVFSTPKGLDAIIDKIEKEVKSIDRDISTAKGRYNIRSVAAKLAKSKTALDKMGKDLTESQRAQIAAVNAERSRAWDRMEALQAEIRKPLTDWEDAEKDRVKGHEDALLHITQMAQFSDTPSTADIEARIVYFSHLAPRNWQEFETRYNDAVKTLSGALEVRLTASKKQDAERAELERLRKEEVERKQKEHEELIAREAAEKAKAESEAKAKAEAEALAAKVKAEQEKAEQGMLRIIREKEESEAKAKKAEEDRIAAIKTAETDAEMEKLAAEERAKLAKIQADKDVEAAAQLERDKIAAEKKAEADALGKREADNAHKGKIHNEILQGIMLAMGGEHSGNDAEAKAIAKDIVKAIAKGEIPHVRIQY